MNDLEKIRDFSRRAQISRIPVDVRRELVDDLEKEIDILKDAAKERGMTIITPQDKLDSYMEGLKLIRGKLGCEAGEASHWEAIGDQYKRMNQLGLARAAYQTAMNALQKVAISDFFKIEEKLQWEKDLIEKLKDVE